MMVRGGFARNSFVARNHLGVELSRHVSVKEAFDAIADPRFRASKVFVVVTSPAGDRIGDYQAIGP
jgi:hypothetical protein